MRLRRRLSFSITFIWQAGAVAGPDAHPDTDQNRKQNRNQHEAQRLDRLKPKSDGLTPGHSKTGGNAGFPATKSAAY